MALASEPPLPIVDTLSSSLIPWKPVIIGIPPSLRYFKILLLLIKFIFEFLYDPFVKTGICQASHDLDLRPLWINLPAIKEQATCSPEDTKTSYSDGEKFLLTAFDFLINSFVTPLIAEETTITLYFCFLYLPIISATFLIFLIVPTEVPPNFNTTIFMIKFF